MHFVAHTQDRPHFEAPEVYVIWVFLRGEGYVIHTVKYKNQCSLRLIK